jgi:hypothetical protein
MDCWSNKNDQQSSQKKMPETKKWHEPKFIWIEVYLLYYRKVLNKKWFTIIVLVVIIIDQIVNVYAVVRWINGSYNWIFFRCIDFWTVFTQPCGHN